LSTVLRDSRQFIRDGSITRRASIKVGLLSLRALSGRHETKTMRGHQFLVPLKKAGLAAPLLVHYQEE